MYVCDCVFRVCTCVCMQAGRQARMHACLGRDEQKFHVLTQSERQEFFSCDLHT